MKITLEEMCDELQKVNRVVVAGHVIPDGDAVGSALALAMILKSIGKDVRVMFDDNIPRNFMMMPTCETIERPSLSILHRIESVEFWNVLEMFRFSTSITTFRILVRIGNFSAILMPRRLLKSFSKSQLNSESNSLKNLRFVYM